MAKVFNPANRDKLHSKERERILPAQRILQACGLKEGQVFLDVGCGNGYFSLPAAQIVGAAGEVHAFDISQEMLDDLKERMQKRALDNIKTYQVGEGGTCGTEIEEQLTARGDMMLMANILHEVEEPADFLECYLPLLKDQARLLVIDWRKKEMDKGPALEHRLDFESLEKVIREVGLKLEYSRILNERYYLLVADKI